MPIVRERGAPIVVKADGLAAGKGVVVATTLEEAHAGDRLDAPGQPPEVAHNAGGARVVIEEFLEGEEASFIVLCDGQECAAAGNQARTTSAWATRDTGPNTGGMGAYSPAPIVTPEVHARAMREVIMPTIRGMDEDGIAYTGFLYAGLMIDAQGQPRTLEFNCRHGRPGNPTDPDATQSRPAGRPAGGSAPVAHGRLDEIELQWDRRAALGAWCWLHPVTRCSRAKAMPLPGFQADADDAVVFHAGTRAAGGQLVTAGGRVLCVTALADSVRQAQQRAYAGGAGHSLRRRCSTAADIGHRALKVDCAHAIRPDPSGPKPPPIPRSRLPAGPTKPHRGRDSAADGRYPSGETHGKSRRARRCKAMAFPDSGRRRGV